MIKDKRILITGGTGFIGSYIIENLINSNEIVCFDNSYRGSNINYLKNKYGKKFEQKIKLIQGDIRDVDLLKKSIKEFKPDIAIHLASLAGVQTIINNPFETIQVNLFGSNNLISAILKSSVKKVIYTSTSEVYGPTAYQLSEEQNTVQGSPYHPRWSYATSKLFAEHLFVSMEREYGIPVAICRLFNIYGPRQIGEGAINNFIRAAIENKPLHIFGTGTEIRAWCYITDCIQGISLITGKGKGIYNIGHPYEGLTSYALALKIKELSKSKSKLIFKPASSYSDVAIRVPNIQKLQKLGYKPTVNLAEGLKNTIDWHRKTLKK